MKNEIKVVPKGGVGFCGLLTIVLIGLKVAGVTNMSWFWVFSPIILLLLLVLLVILMVIILIIRLNK